MKDGDRPRVALYTRVSTEEQVEHGYSLTGQARKLREFAAGEGWRVVEEIEDDGYSGADPYRPGLRRVLELAENGEVDVVAAARRDRLFRSRFYRLSFERDLKEFGVELVALNDTGHKIGDGVLDDFAEWEREMIAERLHGGIKDMISGGEIKAGPKPPYGFRFDETGKALVVREPEMSVVARIFREMAVGASAGSMIRSLDAEGVPSPSGLPRWNKKAIAHFLASALYRPHNAEEVAELVVPEVAATLDAERVYGLWCWNRRETVKRKEWDEVKREFVIRYGYKERPRREWLVVPVDITDAGLSAATVDRAREAAKDRYRRPSGAAGRFWQLRGIAYCGECGSILSPHTVTRKRVDGTTVRVHYHQCRRHFNTGPRDCDHTTSYRAEVLEESIWEAIYGLVSDPRRLLRQYEEHIEREARVTRWDPEKEAARLANELRGAEEERLGYLRQNARRRISDEELDAMLSEVETRRTALRKALGEAQARRDALRQPRINMAHLNSLLLQMNAMRLGESSPQDRRRLYQALGMRADVDADGTIRLSGIFDPQDVYLPNVLQDPPDWLSPRPEVKEQPKMIVASGDTHWRT